MCFHESLSYILIHLNMTAIDVSRQNKKSASAYLGDVVRGSITLINDVFHLVSSLFGNRPHCHSVHTLPNIARLVDLKDSQ